MKARWLWLVMVVFIFVGGTAQTAWADEGCFQQANACFADAAWFPSWWMSFIVALDCELEFISCVRTKVLGV